MSDILNVKFTASADFGQLISEANRAMAVLSKFRNQALSQNIGLDKKDFDTAVGEFRKAVTAAGLYNSTMVDVTSSTAKFGKELAGQRLKLKDYYNAWAEYSRGAQGQIRKLAQEQVRMQSSVVKSLGRDMTGAQKAMVFTPTGIDAVANAAKIASQELSIYHKVLRDGSTSLINWGKNTQWAGRQLTVGLTLPLAMFGKSASEAFRMADQELTRLLKVYGGIGGVSSAELGKVREDVTELAKTLSSTYGASFQETLGLAADIAATGKEGNDLLGSIAETTRLATLGDVDRQEAMKATLALQTAFNMNTKELAESINFLNAVENQTSTTLQDLVEAIPKAGPVIEGLGGGVKELAVMLTAMREGGINASEGANALKSGLASLINPTKVSVEMMSGFGIAINDIVQSNAGDIIGLLTDLKGALDKLDPLQKQQAIEQLFGKYQFARIGALLDNLGTQGSQTLQVFDLMKASTSELGSIADRELKQLTESASGRYKRALESFKAAIADVGEPFLNIFAKILEVGSKVLGVFDRMPRPLKAFVTGMGVITALAGPLIMLTGLMANFFGYIIKGVNALRQFRSGAEAFTLVSTETVAAEQVADAYTQTLYNQKQAAQILRVELEKLAMAYSSVIRGQQGGAPGPGTPPISTGPSGAPGPRPSSPRQSGAAASAEIARMQEVTGAMASDPAMKAAIEQARKMVAEKGGPAALTELQKTMSATKGSGGIGTPAAIATHMAVAQAMGRQTGLTTFKGYGEGDLDITKPLHVAHPDPKGKVAKTLAPGLSTPERNMQMQTAADQFIGMTEEDFVAQAAAGLYIQEGTQKGKGTLGIRRGVTAKEAGTAIKAVSDKYGSEAGRAALASSMVSTGDQGSKPTALERSVRRKNQKIQRDNIRMAKESARASAEASKTATAMRSSTVAAMRFANTMGMAVGTIGMASSMLLGMTGSTNELANKAANFAMALGYGIPAISSLSKGLKGLGSTLAKSGGLVGGLGRGLAMLGGPYGMAAVAGIMAVYAGFKFLQKKQQEALAKAKADISVSAAAVEKFGGVALNAAAKFQSLNDATAAIASGMAGDRNQLVGLPGQKEIEAVREDVKNLMQDQIKAAGGLNSKEAAITFASNLKSALVSQGVAPAQADAILGAILDEAGKKEYTVPVMLSIKGIQNKEDAFQVLSTAANKTFEEIRTKLNDGIYINEATRGRFAQQISDLAGIAVTQVNSFEDIKTVIDKLPEGMKNLNFEQLNATYSGQQLLEKIKATNEPLYNSLMNAENLGSAIAEAAANTLGLVSGLAGVEAQFDIAAQQAQNLVMAEALAESGLKSAFDSRIAAENATIAKIKKRAEAKKNAAEKAKEYEQAEIDKLKEQIDLIKEQADARKDLLNRQKEQADYEREIGKLGLEQKAAMMTGNFAEAAIIGLDIEKKMQDRSVQLAEKAIDDKANAEIKKRELEIQMHEDRKKAIKELTDEQIKAIDAAAAKEISAHQKTIASLREKYTAAVGEFNRLYVKAAQGVGAENQKAYDDLKKLLGDSGANVGILQGSFTKFAEKASADFKKMFYTTIKQLLGSRYSINDKTGVITDTTTGKVAGNMGTGFLNMFGFTGGAGLKYFEPPKDYIKNHDTVMRFTDPSGATVDRKVTALWSDGKLTGKTQDIFNELTAKGYAFQGYALPRYMGGSVKKNYKIKAYAANGINTTASALPYMVGEKGPELFIPGMNGNVVSSERLLGAVRQMNMSPSAGAQYNINVNVANTGASAQEIASAIAGRMRLEEQRIGVSRTVG